jgi:hypothetical protein
LRLANGIFARRNQKTLQIPPSFGPSHLTVRPACPQQPVANRTDKENNAFDIKSLSAPSSLAARAAIGDRGAVNLAAFASASGSLVAAVRGVCNRNSRPGHALRDHGLEFSAVGVKEHDA